MIRKLALGTLLVSFMSAFTFEDAKEVERNEGVYEALGMYKKLAKEQNHPEAMYRLARIYASGKAIKKSLSTSKKYLEKASELGHNESSYSLGKMYLSKKSPYHDKVKAYNSFVKAANNNHAKSLNILGKFLVKGVVVDKDYKLAVKYFERASKLNLIEAQCNLAYMYATGRGVFLNFGRAHAFAKEGYKQKNKQCIKVWKQYKLHKYPNDDAWKFNFYTKPENS